jgi:hypothetical protein
MNKKKKTLELFCGTKKVKKPITVSFTPSDGSIVRFRATKIINKPTKIKFYPKKKKYRK